LHVFLTLALDGGEWSASHISHLAPGTHWRECYTPKWVPQHSYYRRRQI